MKKLEQALYETDFSKYTDLKDRLAGQLFSRSASKSKVVAFPFARLSDEQAELVNAAQGISPEDPFHKKPE